MSSGVLPSIHIVLISTEASCTPSPTGRLALFEGALHLPCLNNPCWPQMSTDTRKHFPMTFEKVNPYPYSLLACGAGCTDSFCQNKDPECGGGRNT